MAAMILAAGRGERMRPLSDALPKPLLQVGGKALIAWQIEALARAGIRDIAINAAHLAERLVAALGDGAAFGVTLRWSFEPQAYEAAGGIATGLPLLPPGPALIVSGDIWTEFDYATLLPRAAAMAGEAAAPRVHLVMVPNPPYHPSGDFTLDESGQDSSGRGVPVGSLRIADDQAMRAGSGRRTFGNIGVYDTALFRELPRGSRCQLLPLFRQWIAAGLVSGELYTGPWANVGTPDELARLDAALRTRSATTPRRTFP